MSTATIPFPPQPRSAGLAVWRSIGETLQAIRAEYLEVPGLRLTRQQAQRFWGLDEGTCSALLQALVDVRFLRRTERGVYVLAA